MRNVLLQRLAPLLRVAVPPPRWSSKIYEDVGMDKP